VFGTSVVSLYDYVYAYKDYVGEAQRIAAVLASLGIENGSLLELACGTGRYLEGFPGFVRSGVDLCEESLMYASFRVPSAQFRCENMQHIAPDAPFTQSFRVILALFGALGYIPPQQLRGCLQAWRDCLAEDGILVIEPWHEEIVSGRYTQEYKGTQFSVLREANVQQTGGRTEMHFSYRVQHANGAIEHLERREQLFVHKHEEILELLGSLGGELVTRISSDFREDGCWFLRFPNKTPQEEK